MSTGKNRVTRCVPVSYAGCDWQVKLAKVAVSVGELEIGAITAPTWSWPYGRLVVAFGGGEPCVLTPNQVRRVIGRLWEAIEGLEVRQ